MRFLIIQDYKENRAKCTLTPLEGREDLEFLRIGHPSRCPAKRRLDSVLLLHVSGEPLRAGDAALAERVPVALIDSTWARVSKVLDRLEVAEGAIFHRRSIPREFRTAYPRKSKLYEDPGEGLASVEALFAVTAVFGRPRDDLLTDYRWAPEFLERNREILRKLCPGFDLSGG